MPVVPWGGGSGTQGGALPIHGGIVLDLRSLDAVDRDRRDLDDRDRAGRRVNGRELEAELNARGLMLPHYPASVEWATVGGYIAARGSGVLSTRYGKIEDLVLSLRVATPAGGLIETVGVPRHAVGTRADAAVRRLGGHARRDHARDAPARAAAGRRAGSPPSRSRRVDAGDRTRSAARCRPATARRSCACTTRRPRG